MTSQPQAGTCRICGFVHYGSCVQALTRALQGALHDLNKVRLELHEYHARLSSGPGQAQREPGQSMAGAGQRESTVGPGRGPGIVVCEHCIELQRAITERDVELQQLRPRPGRFDRAAYQRQYMRSWRAKQAATRR